MADHGTRGRPRRAFAGRLRNGRIPTMRFAVDAVDAHAEGQHGRVVAGGVGVLAAPGATMFEKMKYFEKRADWFRRLMLHEPRGYPRACVNVLLPTTDPGADAGFVIMEQSQLYAAMSGTNLMVVTTVLLETGIVPMVEPTTELRLEVPAGLIDVRAHCEHGRVVLVEFENVASFATALDVPIHVPGFGTVPVSVAWGGMACAVVSASDIGVELVPEQAKAVQEAIIAVCGAARAQIGFTHPLNGELSQIEAVVVMGAPHDTRHDARQTCGLPGGQMDTSPSGTGTSAAMAILTARGRLAVGDSFRTEGVLGGVFRCEVARETDVAGVSAIVPRIGGRAWITGYARYILQDDDPYPEGFVMGDIWPMANTGSEAARLSALGRSP
jgi:proline racemase